MKNEQELEQWLARRKEASLLIDPATAEVDWSYGVVGDPYGIGNIPEEHNIGRQYFARVPGGDVWVAFEDLPEKTREALWDAHKKELAFPAGLPAPGGQSVLIMGLIMDPEGFWTHHDALGYKVDATVKVLDIVIEKLVAIRSAAPG